MSFIRFASRDPGAANVITGLLPAIDGDFDVWAMPVAIPVYERAGVPVTAFADKPSPEQLQEAWRERPADVLITGTSHYDPFESVLWELAGRDGCPSLALLDSWVNLAARFVDRRPDYVGAIDRGQAGELQELGFDAEQVLLTGHPWLLEVMALAERRPTSAAPDRRGDVHVLFVSEPIAGDVAKGLNEPFGFDEFDSFAVVHRAAAEVAASGKAVHLAIKFHPYDDPDEFTARLEELPGQKGLMVLPLGRTAAPHPWVLWADLVTGVGSMLMLEAIVLGRPVISVQPGLAREETFVASQRGCTRTLTDSEDAVVELRTLIASEDRRWREAGRNRGFLELLPPDSTSSILDWLRAIPAR